MGSKRAPALAALALALPALGAPFGCARREEGPPAPRLVLLYAPCTVNRDHLGPYNPAVRYTPALSAFAREATVFQRHQTEIDQSGPAYASIFSGAQVNRHGIYGHPSRLRDDLYLLAEAFADHGYDTHFWSGHPMASADLNYGQGVRPANVHLRRWGVVDLDSLTANDAEFAAILGRLRSDPSYRAFVQGNFTITHAPYTGIDPQALADLRRDFPGEWPDLTDAGIALFTRRYSRNRLRLQWDFPAFARERRYSAADVRGLALTLELYYKARVRLLDRCFGRLIDSIRTAGVLEQSLIAFTADHGEALYSTSSPCTRPRCGSGSSRWATSNEPGDTRHRGAANRAGRPADPEARRAAAHWRQLAPRQLRSAPSRRESGSRTARSTLRWRLLVW